MEAVVGRENMLAAYWRVRKNTGSPGVGGMTVENWGYCTLNWSRIKDELLEGRYEPQPVLKGNTQAGRRGATIGHPDGVRPLGAAGA